MTIKLYNTLTRKKEEFKPIKKGEVSIYTCGPTVYHYAHIGNLRSYVFSDTLRRMFSANNYTVKQVMNITDVGHLTDDADQGEDKMAKGARREKKTVWEIAEHYTKAFMKDMKALNIHAPETVCKATEHIKEMITMVQTLEKNSHTYTAGGNVYFDTSTFKDYGKMAKLKLDDKENKARVEKDKNKKHPFDFVLWFTKHKYTNPAMQWDSPWGKGFPGWHIECSAMSTKYLGEQFDIHTGGIDHIPVHHTNEIAQNQGACKHQVVHTWMHNNFLVNKEGKMAKSKGEFFTLDTLSEEGYNPLDYRYYLLGTQYRKELMFSLEGLESAKNARWKLNHFVLKLNQEKKRRPNKNNKTYKAYHFDFMEAINDDLNTAQALAILWDVIKDEELGRSEKHQLLLLFDEVLGLELGTQAPETLPRAIQALKDKRDRARESKDWKGADKFRDELTKKGFEVLDEKKESLVRKKH